ncbi:hypothetical protein JGL56_06300 [Salmonella enterica subsp. enterica serovar Derby]|nr:hypothetical protein [Salmonella enterica subsp. enterica serovar Derby]
MADPLATVLSHLTNLVSFRSSLRLLIIAGSIICSWVFIAPMLTPFKLPSELSLGLITVIGFSIGALTYSILFNSVDFIYSSIKKRILLQKNKLELQKQAAEKEINDRKEIDLFKSSFNDYSFQAKNIMLKLNKSDSTITLEPYSDSEHNKAFMGLLESRIILPLHRLDKKTTFCTINPLYKPVINQLFEFKHRKEVDDLFDLNPDGLKMLMKNFLDFTLDENHIFRIPFVSYQNRYNYQPVIKNEIYELGEYIDNCNIQFYIDDHHYPYVHEKFGAEIRSYILGNYNEERALKRLGQLRS